jgi:hypothetical protein
MSTDKEWHGCEIAWFVSDAKTHDFHGLSRVWFVNEYHLNLGHSQGFCEFGRVMERVTLRLHVCDKAWFASDIKSRV